MFSDLLLVAWSFTGLVWWLIAWRLVISPPAQIQVSEKSGTQKWITIFKPIPPLGKKGEVQEAALESFLAQLDGRSDLLLGIHEIDRASTALWVTRMQERYPQTNFQVIFRTQPDDVANPKIAWLKILAEHARGELWLWSDVDITAPPDFLSIARKEFAEAGASMLTFPYVVREMMEPPGLLDALFVNAEFYPGALLLRQRGSVDFGFGAAMLFSREAFAQRVTWNELGSALADDFILGQKLQPVRIGTVTLTTGVDTTDWSDAILHYLRWSKTIWWNRPLGTAARIVILPTLGWLIAVALDPSHPLPWVGLVTVTQIDFFFAVALCRRNGCRFDGRDFLIVEAWTVGRVLAWLACFLPWPVIWRGRCWWTPRFNLIK